MSRAQAKAVGERIEALVIERRGLTQLDLEAIDAPDALGSDGTPVEVKACRETISNGDAYGTAGRWYLRQRAHEELVAQGGDYLLVVYRETSDDDLEVVREELVPATIVGSLVSTWTDVARDGEAVAKLSHRVLEAPEVEQA